MGVKIRQALKFENGWWQGSGPSVEGAGIKNYSRKRFRGNEMDYATIRRRLKANFNPKKLGDKGEMMESAGILGTISKRASTTRKEDVMKKLLLFRPC